MNRSIPSELAAWPSGGSEMARRIREHDWAATPLGPIEAWPQSLRTAVDMVLAMPGPANILWGPAHVQLYNDAYVAVAKERHPALLGRPAAEGWPEVHAEVLAPVMNAAFAGRATRIADLSVTLEGPNGRQEERAFDTTWSPIPDGSGAVGGALEILVEVTDRKRVELELRESEEKFRTLFESIDEGLAIVEMIYAEDGEIVDMIFRQVNSAYERETGIGDAVGRSIYDIIPGVEDYWIDVYKDVATTGQPARLESYQQDVDMWFDVHFTRVDDDGRFVAIVFRNTTVRKRAEAELREREERQAYLLRLSDILQRLTEPTDIKTTAMHMLGRHLGVSRAQYHEVDETGEYYSADGIGFADGLPLLDLKYRIDQFGSFVAEDFEAGRPFRSGDLLADPRPTPQEREAYGFYGIRAGAGIPLLRGGKLVAILAVHDTRPHPWSDLEMELIRETAERVWVAVEKIRTEIALRESEERQAFLLKLSDALRPLADPLEVQREAARVLGEALGAGRAAYAEIEADDAHFVVHWDYTDGVPSFAGRYPLDGYGAPEFWADLRGGRSVTVRDAERDERLPEADRSNYAAGKVRAAAAIPLVKGRRLAAVFFLHFAAPHHWTPDQLALVEETAERTWAALERARAEAALRESEEKFRSLFESMDEAFALCELVRDADGRGIDYRYVELNPALIRHVGISPETLVGRRATEVFSTVDPWLVETYSRAVDEGQSVLTEHHFAHVDRWLRINVFPRGGDRFAALYSDVTERHRTQATLRESEQRQAFLLRFTDALRSEPNERALIERAVQMLAEELAVDRAYATRHYPAQDLTIVVFEVRGAGLAPLPDTLRFSDFPEAGRQTFERTLIFEDTANDQSLTEEDKVSLASMGVGALLSRPLRRDGSPIFALGVVSTLPRRWTPAEVALIEDAAERTWEAAERARAEAGLRASEERLRKVLDTETVGVVFFDFVGGIHDANDAFLSMIGYTREELEAGEVRYERLTPPEWRWRDAQTIAELKASGRAGPFEKEYTRKDGSRIWILCADKMLDGETAVEFIIDVTERKRAEELRRESEERLRTVLDGIGEAFYALDRDGCFLFASRSALEMWGKRSDDILGRPFLECFPQAAGSDAYEAHRRVMQTSVAEQLETVSPVLGRWIEVHLAPTPEGGLSVGLRDIDARKRAEAALRESEQRLALAFKTLPVGIAIIDAAGTTIMTNDEMRRFLPNGIIPSRDLSRVARWRAWDADRRPVHSEAFPGMRALRGEIVSPGLQLLYLDDAGREIWTEVLAAPLHDGEGRISGALVVVVDIDRLKRSEEAARESEARLRNAIEVGRLGLWDWNLRTGEVRRSEEHVGMEGAAPGAVPPTFEAWADRIHPDDRAPTEAALRRAMETHEEFVREFRVVDPDGSARWLYARGRFFYDEGGRPMRMIGAMVDTTERREWEERQKVLVAELQHRTRNLMGVVRSLSLKTLERSSSLEDFRERFMPRVEALARVNGLLSRLDEGDRVTFDELLQAELQAHGAVDREGHGRQVTLEGPLGVRLQSSTVQTFALALHELATNAVKYGALAQPKGHLAVRWRLVPDGPGPARLRVEWQESGVAVEPPEDGTPRRRGYGSELIERALPYALGAETAYALGPDGVRCTITLPISTTQQEAAHA